METEKACEFCMSWRPVIYCKADAAYLCLSCDAKVHSANALSYRHPRTLMCESCSYEEAYVRCMDHQMFMCRDCDRTNHNFSLQHQKKVISYYIGCPSAKDLAVLWGFNLQHFDRVSLSSQFASSSKEEALDILNSSRDSSLARGRSSITPERESQTSTVDAGGRINQHAKECYIGCMAENTSLILQQILDLERLQLTERSENSSFRNITEQSEISSLKGNTSRKLPKGFDQHLSNSLSLGSDAQDWCSPDEEPTAEPFSFAISQLDGDSFWQCRSPGQLWPQNMQDLGVCDEQGCFDNFNMPDVDLTFRNFEEQFGGEQDLTKTMLDEKDMTCSSFERDSFTDLSDNADARTVEDVSMASAVCHSPSLHTGKDTGYSVKAHYFSPVKECPRPIRPSYSALSLSRFSSESSGTEYMDSVLSPTACGQELSCTSHDSANAYLQGKENVASRYREKKKVRQYDKQARYDRKSKSTVKKQVKGQFLKTEGYESDSANVARSF